VGVSSNGMTKLLKKEQRGVIAQLCSLDVFTLESSISLDLQKVLEISKKSWKIIPRYLRLPKVAHLFVIMTMLFI